MIYKLVINNDILEEYNKYYFKKYPKRHKAPIDSPIHPSLNKWAIAVRMQANTLKQNWGEFGLWLVTKYGYNDLKIEKAQITVKYYYGTKHRHDNDNVCPKFAQDFLVKSGMIIDDDYLHLNPLIIYGDYDKQNPRTEIWIETEE